MKSFLTKTLIGLILLPLIYFSVVRLSSQLVIPTDHSSLWATPPPTAYYSPDRLPLVLKGLSTLDPLSAEYRKALATSLMATDDPDSEPAVRRSIHLSSIDPENWVMSGMLRVKRGQADEGMAGFEKAISLNPGRAATYLQAGLHLFDAAALCSAEKRPAYRNLAELDLSLAITLDPSLLDDPRLSLTMAAIAAEKGDKSEAISYLKRVTLLPPLDRRFAIRKLALCFSLDEPVEALHSWRKMFVPQSLSQEEIGLVEAELRKYPIPDFAYFVAELNALQGKLESARTNLTSLVAVRPGIAEYRLALGTINEKLRNFREAGACYEKALELSPASQEAKEKVIAHFSGQKPLSP